MWARCCNHPGCHTLTRQYPKKKEGISSPVSTLFGNTLPKSSQERHLLQSLSPGLDLLPTSWMLRRWEYKYEVFPASVVGICSPRKQDMKEKELFWRQPKLGPRRIGEDGHPASPIGKGGKRNKEGSIWMQNTSILHVPGLGIVEESAVVVQYCACSRLWIHFEFSPKVEWIENVRSIRAGCIHGNLG